jgi:hypothetical protein
MVVLQLVLVLIAAAHIVLMLAVLRENVAQLHRGEVINRAHAVGLIMAPALVIILCIIAIIGVK